MLHLRVVQERCILPLFSLVPDAARTAHTEEISSLIDIVSHILRISFVTNENRASDSLQPRSALSGIIIDERYML
jgi:hypothetical protein